ncbi:MAG: biotin synthase BioB [Phycisphaerales bacterium]|nr:MAG: biotin synthase BioB [Phycisphaerales bacterium]
MDTAIETTRTLLNEPLEALIARANQIRKEVVGDTLDLCSILNARSGRCREDCKFCAQSARHHTETPVYPLKDASEIVEAAGRAQAIGARRFGIVTSGNRLTDTEADVVAGAITRIRQEVGIAVCASLGALSLAQLQRLKAAGLSRYHHNIETSRRFYAEIVTTHDFQQRVDTVAAAKEAGLEVCSGGIIGMGETWQDRLDMATTLRELQVDSVPINILIPIEGTALETAERLSVEDIVRTICIFRLLLPSQTIRIAAGRETALAEDQIEAFRAGASGMLIGGYLTVKGAGLEADRALAEQIRQAWTV